MQTTFEAPGKGSWMMDATHCPKPLTGFLQEVFAPALSRGMQIACERYGMLLDTFVIEYVAGFPYLQPKPVGAPAGSTGLPPKALFKLFMWLHPAIRRRLRTAEGIFERRPWRDELRDWDERVKRRTIEGHRRIHAVDVAALSDEALGGHLKALVAHAIAMVTQDHSYNMTYMVPLGDYLAHGKRWTGADSGELMALLRGHSDASVGELDEKRKLVALLRADAEAGALLDPRGDAAEALDALAARDDALGAATRDYLLIVGSSLGIGITLVSPSLREQPAVLLDALRASLTTSPRRNDGVASREAALRQRVPETHRAEFDVLLADARLVYRLRDERHLYGALPLIWPVRRALLEAGRRLVERGQLPDPELALFAFSHELTRWLGGEPCDAAALEERRRHYHAADGFSVPATFGPAPEQPPSDWLPPAARRLGDALDAYFSSSNEPDGTRFEADAIVGMGVSGGVCEGIARRCDEARELERIAQGDILVSATTNPAINVVLPLLGAIVTDTGGALSHAAIVTREFGIPGVVGTKVATRRIKDGDRIRVDGDRGIVEILSTTKN